MTPTPRTDAECAKRYEQGYQLPDLRELCAQIERELVEALAQRDRLASLIGSIFFYGGFKAETYNERELEKELRALGYFFESETELMAKLQPQVAPTHTFNGHPVTLVSNNGPLTGMVEIERADGSTEYVYTSELIPL